MLKFFLTPLRAFITTKTPTKLQALSVLRGLFATMFLAQIIVAILLASIMLIFTDRQNSGPLMAQILLMFTLLQLPIGISLPMFTARYGGKGASLSAVILMAVLLSSPSWFASFAFLTGSPSIYLMLILMFVMLYYSVGFMLCNRYANLALIEPETP